MSWLLRSNETPAAPVDLAKVRSALAALEAVFPSAATARQRLEGLHGPINTPAKAHQLAALKAETERAIALARLDVERAFADTMKATARNVHKAQRDYAASPDGQQQLAALAGFATIGAKLTGDQVAERLTAALDAGLLGQARAWREVANLQPYADSGKLTAATMRADREAVSPEEMIANGQVAYVNRARAMFAAYSNTIGSRFDNVTTDGTDANFVGNFQPEMIFGDVDHPKLGGDQA